MANRKDEFCCMCGSKKDDVDKLIKGRYGYICDIGRNEAKMQFFQDFQKVNL